MPIRQATLDDTSGITKLFVEQVERWQRMNSQGQVDDLPYEALSIYERWLHGGAWLSVETGALWLTHLVAGAGIPLVYDNDGIQGYAEGFIGDEADPFGYHLHIGKLVGRSDAIRDAIMDELIVQAGGIGRLMVASTVYDYDRIKFFGRFGLHELTQIQRVSLAAQGASVGFYKVTDHTNTDIKQIATWQMPIGRVESSRWHWEHLWAQLWHAVPEIVARKTHRLRFNAGGQDAFVVVQEHLYNPRNAEVFCWTPKALSAHLIGSIRDWSYKAGYRTLTMAVHEKIAKTLDSDLEKTPHQNVILSRNL